MTLQAQGCGLVRRYALHALIEHALGLREPNNVRDQSLKK